MTALLGCQRRIPQASTATEIQTILNAVQAKAEVVQADVNALPRVVVGSNIVFTRQWRRGLRKCAHRRGPDGTTRPPPQRP